MVLKSALSLANLSFARSFSCMRTSTACWEQTMRETIKDPQYRALKDPRDRKAAFEKYAVEASAFS
jgi:hypothetical protein